MNEDQTDAEQSQQDQPYQIRLPRFITDEPIGLGDVIKRATRVIGIKPCEPCNRRAAALNRWMVFTGRIRE